MLKAKRTGRNRLDYRNPSVGLNRFAVVAES